MNHNGLQQAVNGYVLGTFLPATSFSCRACHSMFSNLSYLIVFALFLSRNGVGNGRVLQMAIGTSVEKCILR